MRHKEPQHALNTDAVCEVLIQAVGDGLAGQLALVGDPKELEPGNAAIALVGDKVAENLTISDADVVLDANVVVGVEIEAVCADAALLSGSVGGVNHAVFDGAPGAHTKSVEEVKVDTLCALQLGIILR